MRVLSFDVGIKNMSYCVINGDFKSVLIEQWGIINIQQGDTSPSIEDCVTLTIDALSAKKDELLQHPVNSIVIEMQPAGGHNVHANVKVKIISHIIQSFFYTLFTSEGPSISFVSAASKLVEMKKDMETGVFQIEMNNTTEDKKLRSRYARNKKYSVFKTRQLLDCIPVDENKVQAKEMFEKEKKQDDLADSFLLGFYYLKKACKPVKVRATKKLKTK